MRWRGGGALGTPTIFPTSEGDDVGSTCQNILASFHAFQTNDHHDNPPSTTDRYLMTSSDAKNEEKGRLVAYSCMLCVVWMD
jgi:hypothetical protein